MVGRSLLLISHWQLFVSFYRLVYVKVIAGHLGYLRSDRVTSVNPMSPRLRPKSMFTEQNEEQLYTGAIIPIAKG